MTIRRCFRVFDECGGCKPLPLAAFEGGDPEHGAIDQADIFCGKVRPPPRRAGSRARRAARRGEADRIGAAAVRGLREHRRERHPAVRGLLPPRLPLPLRAPPA